MPKIPNRDNFNAIPGPANSRITAVDTSIPSDIVTRQNAQLQQGLDSFTNTQKEILLRQQEEANRLRVDDATNRLKEIATRYKLSKEDGYTNLKGFDALNRPDGKPLAEEYTAKLEQEVSNLTDELGNDAQKQMFKEISASFLNDFKREAIAYEGEQYKNYAVSVRKGTITNSVQDSALNFNNPERIKKNIMAIEYATKDIAVKQGLSANEAEGLIRDNLSMAHSSVISQALNEGEVEYAKKYFDENVEKMNAKDIIKYKSLIEKSLKIKLANEAVSNTISSNMDRLDQSEADRAFNILLGTESSNRHFDSKGNIVTSPKGAIGIAQVMPATAKEAAKLAGIEWDEERYKKDPEYNKQLGKAYFEKQLRSFKGSLQKAYAAYNAGPTAVRKAIKEAEKEGNPESWLSKLPKETQNYVVKNMNEFSKGGGKIAKPTLGELKNELLKELGPNADKATVKEATTILEREYKAIDDEIQAKEDRAVSQAMQYVIDTNGDFANMPLELKINIPPEKYSRVLELANKLSKGDLKTDLKLYNDLVANPEKMVAMSDDRFSQLQAKLSPSDFKTLARKRGEMLNGAAASSSDTIDFTTINRVLGTKFAVLDIDQKKDADKAGRIRQFIIDKIATEQKKIGRSMTDTEIISTIDEAFKIQSEYDGWLFDSKGPALAMKASEIPSRIKKYIKRKFRQQGNTDPTDADMLQMYWQYLDAKEKAKR